MRTRLLGAGAVLLGITAMLPTQAQAAVPEVHPAVLGAHATVPDARAAISGARATVPEERAAVPGAAAAVPGAHAAPPPDGAVQIRVGQSRQCLNIKRAASADGTPLIQWPCDQGEANALFTVVPAGGDTDLIVASNAGKCLTVVAGEAVQQQPCDAAAANDRWRFSPVDGATTYRIASVLDGKCLNVHGDSVMPATPVVVRPCSTSHDEQNDQFYFPPAAVPALGAPQPAPIDSPVAAEREGNALVYAYVTNDGTLIRGRQPDARDFTHIAWTALPGRFSGGATAAVQGDGRVSIAARHADDGDLWQTDGDSFRDVGGSGIGLATTVRLLDYSRLTFTVVAGELWVLPQDGYDVPYGQWRYAGGTDLVGKPAAEQRADGTVRVYVVTVSGNLLVATYSDGRIGDLTSLGGAGLITGTPAVTAGGERSRVVMRTTGGGVVSKLELDDGTFPAAWTEIAGAHAAGTPAAVVDDASWLTVIVVRGTDGLLYRSAETGFESGTFGAWTPLSRTPVATDPTPAGSAWVARTASGRVLIAGDGDEPSRVTGPG